LKMDEVKLYVLDTHILIWYFIGSRRLDKRFKDKVDNIRKLDGSLLIPTIVLSEALDVSEKAKVKFDFNKMFQIIRNEPEFEVVGFSSEIFEETIRIKKIKEIHDRIIVATARFYSAGIITKDKIIQESDEIAAL
jgi:PIN domain nuclease of toxin-antitoxin system